MKDQPRVMVTGVGGRSVGHQILHALLIAGSAYEITAVDADPFSFGLYQVEKRYIVPSAGHPGYLDAIIKLIRSGRIQIILPGTEAELFVLTENREQLADEGCLLLANPLPVVRICADKRLLATWLAENDFGTPRTVPSERWRELAQTAGFPLVGKPATNTGGSRHVAILKDEGEVSRYLEETAGVEILFQEYMDAAEEEYTVGVCLDRDGGLIDSIVLQRKLVGLSLGTSREIDGRTFTLSTGYSQGFVVDHPRIRSFCEELVRRLGMKGPANIQCRLVGGEVKVFEVHPRFSGTTSIRADVGFNEPDILIRNFLFGESFGRIEYRKNVAAIRAFQSCIVPISELATVPRVS